MCVAGVSKAGVSFSDERGLSFFQLLLTATVAGELDKSTFPSLDFVATSSELVCSHIAELLHAPVRGSYVDQSPTHISHLISARMGVYYYDNSSRTYP